MTAPAPSPGPAERRLVVELGRALHEAGFPTPQLEAALGRVASRLGLVAQVFATPTSLFCAFGAGSEQRTHLERVEPAGFDLGRLARLDDLVDRLAGGRVDAKAAPRELAAIAAAGSPYPPALELLCWGLSSAATALFLGGGVREATVGGAIGLAVGLLSRLAGSALGRRGLFEPVAAALAAALATAVATLWAPLSVYVATLAGIIFLIPGFTLTVALSELALRHLSSGTARFASALVVFLTVTFGTAVGGRLGALLVGGAPVAAIPAGSPPWAEAVALLVAPLALTVLFRAPLRDAPWIVVVGFLGYQGGRLGGEWLSPELGMFLGALAVGLASGLFERLTGRPAAIPLVPSILLLVPGSIGYRSLASLLERDVLFGIETAFRMLLIAVSLVAGLLVGQAVTAHTPPARDP